MVKAELSYNPYLRETIVNFNGQAPRINSQIEKYQDISAFARGEIDGGELEPVHIKVLQFL